jgi:hypothetical protein
MHYVLFRGHLAATPSSTQTSDKYYNIARSMTGFLTESSWRDPTNSAVQFLFATFADEEAVKAWRDNTLRLGMMHSARTEVLKDFRIAIGSDEGEGTVVLVYRRPALPATTEHGVTVGDVAVRKDEERVEKLTSCWEVYTREEGGKSEVLFVWMLERGVDVEDVVESIERVEGDQLEKVHVLREYSKSDRRHAPAGLDRAEEEAVASVNV